jgi:periplasmic mercuric ion binding protein
MNSLRNFREDNIDPMKNKIYKLWSVTAMAAILGFTGCAGKKEEGSKTTFKVYGNCEMCKTTIEGSLKDEKGVSFASWDVDKKIMTVSFDSTLTNSDKIQTRIASSGYDTELKKGSDEAYKNLHACCQYDRKK